MARWTTARMRHGSEATWQGRGWPTLGARGAHGADTWRRPRVSTRVHVGARVGGPRGRGSVDGGPTG